MLQNSGLLLNQAPPIKVILRLFLSGSIFGIAVSVMLFFWHGSLSDISNPKTLAIVHTLTLGVMASFMLGALFQMMPVLCGVAIDSPDNVALRVNYTLFFGTIFLILAFIYSTTPLYILALFFLAYAIFTALYIMIKKLLYIKHSNSSRGMLFALIGLGITVSLAFALIAMRAGLNLNLNYLNIKSLHYSFGLFGWISMLIISVSFQVIEMFYVAPPYNKTYAKYIPIVLIVMLVLYAMSLLMGYFGIIFPYIISLLVAIHAIYTLYNLKRKKRPISDASFWFWTLGIISALAFTTAVIFNISILIISTFFTIFFLSVVFALSYKIVPFLVWFHLNAKGYYSAPMMHEIVAPRYAKINFWILLVTSILLIFSTFYQPLYYLSSTLLFLSFAMLFIAIYRAIDIYFYTLAHGKKLNLSFS